MGIPIIMKRAGMLVLSLRGINKLPVFPTMGYETSLFLAVKVSFSVQ